MKFDPLKLMTALIPNVFKFLIFSLQHSIIAMYCRVYLSHFKLLYYIVGQAAVMLSPSDIAKVCVGGSLEFTCDITGIILEWSFPRLSGPQAMKPFTRAIMAENPSETQTYNWIDNSTVYQFTRTSANGSPVSSRLLISSISNSHNGTAINCSNVASPTETASTTIIIIDSQIEGMRGCLYRELPGRGGGGGEITAR